MRLRDGAVGWCQLAYPAKKLFTKE
ncbi:hypothetical protein HKBW3S44_01763, partial [Candidatus Hakubella thermalkaliphila]